MKHTRKLLSLALIAAAVCSLSVSAHAADYSFTTEAPADYYGSTSYEDVYGSQYNYGGPNVVDYQIPELEYGSFSTTQTGLMEKALLPGLQQSVYSTEGGTGYGILHHTWWPHYWDARCNNAAFKADLTRVVCRSGDPQKQGADEGVKAGV